MTTDSIPSQPAFLLGIDLEPLPLTRPDDEQSWDDLETLTRVVLACLRRHRWRATFFTVGQVVERRPELVAEILQQGHEIACHTHVHVRFDQYTPDAFKRDLDLNLNVLHKAGAARVHGFRAPFFSLTESAAWAYETLRSCGLKYSSSVSATRDLTAGWSQRAATVAARSQIIELPITPLWTGPLGVPLGGLYWRCCPDVLLARQIRRMAVGARHLTSFFHPHDFYSRRCAYVSRSSYLRNPLIAPILAFGRRTVEDKLDLVARMGFSFLPFQEYLDLDRDREQPERAAAAATGHRH